MRSLTWQAAVMNGNGVVAAVENYGVNDHWLLSVAYFVGLNANGSWGSPTVMWSGNEQFGLTYQPPLLLGLSGNNQVLGSMGAGSYYDTGTDVAVYNINSHTLTNLSTLLGSAGSGGIYQSGGDYVINQPIALDEEGRILLSAYPFPLSLPGNQPTNLLLTPDGLSAAPLEVAAPEPGALVVGLLAIAGFVAHRLREQPREC